MHFRTVFVQYAGGLAVSALEYENADVRTTGWSKKAATD